MMALSSNPPLSIDTVTPNADLFYRLAGYQFKRTYLELINLARETQTQHIRQPFPP